MASASTSDGKAISTSSTRMITVSTNEPQNAAKAPEQAPEHEPDDVHGEGDLQRVAPAVEQPRPEVVADLVGAEQVPGGERRDVGVEDVAAGRRGHGPEQRPDEAQEEQQRDQRAGDDEVEVARPAAPARPRLGDGRGDRERRGDAAGFGLRQLSAHT